jgi:hypothetical protein
MTATPRACLWCSNTRTQTIVSAAFSRWWAFCVECGACGPHADTEADAIAAWNTRAALTRVPQPAAEGGVEQDTAALTAIKDACAHMMFHRWPDAEVMQTFNDHLRSLGYVVTPLASPPAPASAEVERVLEWLDREARVISSDRDHVPMVLQAADLLRRLDASLQAANINMRSIIKRSDKWQAEAEAVAEAVAAEREACAKVADAKSDEMLALRDSMGHADNRKAAERAATEARSVAAAIRARPATGGREG